MNDRPYSLINFLTYLSGCRTRVAWQQTTVRCQWFGVNTGFSDEERLLMEMCTFLKVMEQRKNLLRNFRVNDGTAGT